MFSAMNQIMFHQYKETLRHLHLLQPVLNHLMADRRVLHKAWPVYLTKHYKIRKWHLQFHRGRRPQREIWVLGLVDTQYAPARPYLQLVRRRNAATLLRIIQRKVQPGSIVHSDQWAAYRQLQRRLGLQHGAVNHSLHFVDPVNGVHTRNAESNLCTAKEKFKKMEGNTNPDFLLEYLQEFTWRRWYGEPHPNGYFRKLLDDIA